MGPHFEIWINKTYTWGTAAEQPARLSNWSLQHGCRAAWQVIGRSDLYPQHDCRAACQLIPTSLGRLLCSSASVISLISSDLGIRPRVINWRPSHNNWWPPVINWSPPHNNWWPRVINWRPPHNNWWPLFIMWWPRDNNWRIVSEIFHLCPQGATVPESHRIDHNQLSDGSVHLHVYPSFDIHVSEFQW